MMGPCQFLVCRRVGMTYRAEFCFLLGGRSWVLEVFLCSEHMQICDELRRTHKRELVLSEEGFVYLRTWMASLAFRT